MRRTSASVLLVSYAAALGFWAAARTPPFALPAPGELLEGSVSAAAARALTAMAAAAVLFVPIGWLVAGIARRRGEGPLGLARGLLALGAAALVVHAIVLLGPGRAWRATDALTLALGLLGAALGVCVRAAWLAGPPAWRRLAWTVSAMAVGGLAGAGLLAALAVEPQPLIAPSSGVTSDEKRRVYYVVREGNPRTIPRGHTKTLRLTERDLGVLAAWAGEIAGRDWRTSLDLGSGTVTASGSIPVGGRSTARFLNATVEARPSVGGGAFDLGLEALCVGRWRFPRPAVAGLSAVASAALRHDERLRPFVQATRVLEIEPSRVSVTYGRVDAPPGYLTTMLGQGLTGGVEPETVRAHVQHLLAESRRIPRGEEAVAETLRSAFTFARERSAAGRAVEENKATLLALGILLGHSRLQTFVGRVMESHDWRAVGPAFRKARMHGRSDWTRHFFVSGALTVLSAESVSDAAGLFKEELDADGGSGFSFADLLADRAGTCFALAATRDEPGARATQDRMAAGVRIEDLFPPAADLPERITDAELQAGYGGVGGAGYRRLAAVIESRLPWCEPYR